MTQALHLPAKAQPGHVIIGVEPEPARGARSFGKQTAALTEADSIHGEFRQFRHFSDLHDARGVIEDLKHVERLHSGLRSRVKGFRWSERGYH